MAIQEAKITTGSNGTGHLEDLGDKVEIDKRLPLTVSLEDKRTRRDLVGGKAFGLAELKAIPEISGKVPDGFVITAPVYDLMLQGSPEIKARIDNLDQLTLRWLEAKLNKNNENAGVWERQIAAGGKDIKEMMEGAKIPDLAENEIEKSYDELCRKAGKENMSVAVRSSGVQEDGADKSFAGQNKTELNRRGKKDVVTSTRNCFASQFEERAIVYRNNERLKISEEEALKNGRGEFLEALDASKEFSHGESRIAVVVQKMINSSVSGVALSIDPTTGASRINIDVNNGIGESVVGGEVTPDFFKVDPRTGKIVGRRLGKKGVRTSFTNGGTESIETSEAEQRKFAATDSEIIEIARDVILVKEKLGKEVDMEFARDEDRNLYWVQERSETVGSQKDPYIVEMREYKISEEVAKNADTILEGGITGCPGAASGTKLIASTVEEAMRTIESEENKDKAWILVANMTTPDWVPIMKKVKGIITRRGGRTCHAAIVSREMRVPCLVGTEEEFEVLLSDEVKEITMDARGKKVYRGVLHLEETGEDIDVRELLENPTNTVVGLNISMPDEAERLHALAKLKEQFAVPLVRLEVIEGEDDGDGDEKKGVHVGALIDFHKGKLLPGSDLYRKIAKKVAPYGSAENYFITRISEGLADIAGHFPDSSVTVRTTDFKTNEYANLIGGGEYEIVEDNPMIGWRGLVRFLSPENRDAFKWELLAIKRARDMGNKNIKIMFPMVRDPLELNGSLEEMEKWYGKGFRSAYDIMKEVGLERGRDGLKTLIMVEDETNVERLDDYIDAGIDGISIGSNDLTQLVMAKDRDNPKLQKIPRYSEGNPAVSRKMVRVIERCRERGIDTSICGDAPSSDPEIVKILVKAKVGSMGLTPDSFLNAYRLVKETEESLRGHAAPTVLFP